MFCSCSLQDFSIFGWKPFGQKNDDEHEQVSPIDDVPVDEGTHISSIEVDPKAPFTMVLNTTRQLKVTCKPADIVDNEKLFTWKITSGDGVKIDETSKSNEITVEAVKVSKNNIITVTNDYKPSLSKTFTISVIETDENDYLWQYSSTDRRQFGYDSSDRKLGLASGQVILNGMLWSYSRSELQSLGTGNGGIAFGKDKFPEQQVHFEAENTREINSISIECASQNSLATITTRVGQDIFMNSISVPKASDGVMTTLNSTNVTSARGKITIDITTPPMDESRREDLSYLAPGAFQLKSIFIDFNEPIEIANSRTISLVQNTTDLEDGKAYLLMGKSSNGYFLLDGSLTSSTKDNPFALTDFTFEETKEVPFEYAKFGFSISIIKDQIDMISGSGVRVGTTKAGNLSTPSAGGSGPDLKRWSYTINENHCLDMTIQNANDETRHLIFNNDSGKFATADECNNSIYLFKL